MISLLAILEVTCGVVLADIIVGAFGLIVNYKKKKKNQEIVGNLATQALKLYSDSLKSKD